MLWYLLIQFNVKNSCFFFRKCYMFECLGSGVTSYCMYMYSIYEIKKRLLTCTIIYSSISMSVVIWVVYQLLWMFLHMSFGAYVQKSLGYSWEWKCWIMRYAHVHLYKKTQLSKMTERIFMPTNSIWGFLLLHILTNI